MNNINIINKFTNNNSSSNNNNNKNVKLLGLQAQEKQNLANLLHCRQRVEWTRNWIRKNLNEFVTAAAAPNSNETHMKLIREIHFNEVYHLNCFFDITENQFRFLVNKLGTKITSYQPQRKRKFFTAEERLSITLKFLATGEFNSCRNYCFRASKPVILKMISDICLDIYEALKDDYICTPKTEVEWDKISKEFTNITNLSNCLGDLTVKHIVSKSSQPFSQKTDFNLDNTLVFTSIVDANENFIYVDISDQKSFINDQTVFENSKIKRSIETGELNLPPISPQKMNPVNNLPYFFTTNPRLGLPKKPYLIKSRNETQIESHRDYEFYEAIKSANQKSINALRYLTNIFGAFTYPLKIDLENGRNILLGAVALYNYLRKSEPAFMNICEKIKNYHEECIPQEKMHDYDYLAKPVVFLSDCFQNCCTQAGDITTEETEFNRNAIMDFCFKRILKN